jgi:2-methylaconitate cis-trans-isomerase PrpF
VILAEFQVEDGEFVSEGDFRIDGVPSTGSKIPLDFIGSGGSVTGRLLPTGRVREEVKFPTLGSLEPTNASAVRIGHPTGTIQVEIEIENQGGQLELTKAALARTARLLMDGRVHVR